MSEPIPTKIDRFDGGIVNDPRDPREATARMITNFDVLTNPGKMTPYRDAESGDDSGSTSKKQNFCIAKRTGTTYSLYALGVKSGDTVAEVLYKNLTTGAATDLDDNAWAAPAANQSASGATNFGLFIYYEFVNRIYGLRAGRYIWKFDPSGGAWADSEVDLFNYRDVPNPITEENIVGVVHSKDDILYVGFGANVIKNNNTVWTSPAPSEIELPRKYLITSMCEYGDFLAIACAPASGVENSRIYLWDRDSSVTTLAASIDAGEGIIKILEEVDGNLIAISLSGANGGTKAIRFNDRVIFRQLVGSEMVKFKEILGTTGTILRNRKQKIDNRLCFLMSITLNGAVHEGVWSVGRSSPGSSYTLVHERTPNNDTALTSATLDGFIALGDYLFQAYSSSSTFAVTKTNDSSSYAATAIYESKIFDAGFPQAYKDLIDVTVTHEYLPTAGQVVLRYRIDQETSWTTIFTNTTNNSISHSANNIESTGAALPKYYKEIQFRVESTGGAEISSISFREDVTGVKYNTA